MTMDRLFWTDVENNPGPYIINIFTAAINSVLYKPIVFVSCLSILLYPGLIFARKSICQPLEWRKGFHSGNIQPCQKILDNVEPH
jgi:hypothetical protein